MQENYAKIPDQSSQNGYRPESNSNKCWQECREVGIFNIASESVNCYGHCGH